MIHRIADALNTTAWMISWVKFPLLGLFFVWASKGGWAFYAS